MARPVSAARAEDQRLVEAEAAREGDLLQPGLEDGHRRLGYKILAGLLWSHAHCPGAAHVVKTDDNVVVDLPALVAATSARPPDSSVVLCGCGPPHRNMKTLR